MNSTALIPTLILDSKNQTLTKTMSIASGVALLSVLAQIAIPLAWTPVPITGQTFGIILMALIWGSRQASLVSISYFAVGALGLPVFAMGQSGISFGPTSGYLVGMLAASYVIGKLADLGFAKSFAKALIASSLGSLVIYFCGVLGLMLFVPANKVISLGVAPFLFGDLLKLVAASLIATGVSKVNFKLK